MLMRFVRRGSVRLVGQLRHCEVEEGTLRHAFRWGSVRLVCQLRHSEVEEGTSEARFLVGQCETNVSVN